MVRTRRRLLPREYRTDKNAFDYKCWTQDQIHWAYAGRAAEAQEGLVHRFRHASTQCRFPLYGSAGPDSCPDFDHFGAGSTALQRMLVQEAGDKILLLPAWPADWDVDFKLHLTGGAVIRAKVTDGKLTNWTIEPATRKKDVVVHQPQRAPQRPMVPDNDHPLRIGADQLGGRRFRGQIGRVTMFRGRLELDTIRTLAEGDRKKKPTAAPNPIVACVLQPTSADVLPVKPGDLHDVVSFEAWILPEEAEAGRILDKLTGGRGDGFLLDCWPNLNLRLIVGDRQEEIPGTMKPGVWQHIAVVIDRKKLDLYLDGKKR